MHHVISTVLFPPVCQRLDPDWADWRDRLLSGRWEAIGCVGARSLVHGGSLVRAARTSLS